MPANRTRSVTDLGNERGRNDKIVERIIYDDHRANPIQTSSYG